MRARLLAACVLLTLVLVGSARAQAPALVEGKAFTGTVATFDPPLPSQVTIDWGDGSPTQTTGVTTNPAGKGEVSGTHTYARHGSFRIEVTDKGNAANSRQQYVTVADAPITASPVTFATATAAGGALVATVVDENPLGAASEFAATIAWGDGSTSAGTVSAAAGQPGRYEVRGAHAYPDGSTYIAEVTVTDTDGGDAKAVV